MFKETKSFQTHKPIVPFNPNRTHPYTHSLTWPARQTHRRPAAFQKFQESGKKLERITILTFWLFFFILFLNTDTLHRWPERNIQLLENEPEARRDTMPHHLHLERQHRREQDRKQMANKVHPHKGRGKSIASVQEQ